MALIFLGSFLIVPIIMLLLLAVLGAAGASSVFASIIAFFDSFAVIYVILAVLLLYFICSHTDKWTAMVVGFFNVIMWVCGCMAIGQSIVSKTDAATNVTTRTGNAFQIFGFQPSFTVGTIILATFAGIGFFSAIWAALDSDDSKFAFPISATATAVLAVFVESLFR